MCSNKNPTAAPLTCSVHRLWTSPTKTSCGAWPGVAMAFCQVALAEASGKCFCTGGCMGRSLWDPSLLQRRNCEDDLSFHSAEFSRETRMQSWSEAAMTLPQAQHLWSNIKKTRMGRTSCRTNKSAFLSKVFLN